MDPMKPMEPLKPMEPIMEPTAAWWPPEFNDPAVSGSQNGARYAFFADRKRLLIDRDGATEIYDTGDHHISGVSQGHGADGDLVFTTSEGSLDLTSLRRLNA